MPSSAGLLSRRLRQISEVSKMKKIGRAPRIWALAVTLVFALGMAGSAVAQDPTPPLDAVVTHPSHIHKGSCAELDPNPAFPLNDVGPRLKDDELPPSEDIKGSLSAAP